MTEVVSTSETLVIFYEKTWYIMHNIIEGDHLQIELAHHIQM